ncbi:MAG: hypothetical protein JWN38_76 [Candidatus Saccharibacteria bacterium]|nr:hypothetical protein [Candidatus Saccharibacteria bacterium]
MRTTVTINDYLYSVVRLRAIETGTTIKTVLENAIKFQLLDDMTDLDDAKERFDEPEQTLGSVREALKRQGLLS